MSNFSVVASLSGTSNRPTQPSAASLSAPTPHFDSILRAAPAYDDEEEPCNDEARGTSEDDEDNFVVPTDEGRIDIAKAIRPHLSHHSSLHAYLDGNQMLEEMILSTQSKVHEDVGRLKAKQAELSRLRRTMTEAQTEKGKSSMLWMPKKKSAYRARLTKLDADMTHAQTRVEELERDLHDDKRHLASLESELSEFKRVEIRLDALYNHIFGGLTPDFPEEDDLEKRYYILLQTARRVQAAVQQEKRALQYLNKAYALCETMLKELLKGLQIGIEIGVANNVKHKHQLFVGTGAFVSARASRGLVLRAKTLCGDMHTNYISARGIQRRISTLPKVQVMELTRMPDMPRKNTFDEVGLHRSLESSYAEGKIVKAHIEAERAKCRERQRLLREHVGALESEAKGVWHELRATRRSIVDAVSQRDEGNEVDDVTQGENDSTATTTNDAVRRTLSTIDDTLERQIDEPTLRKPFNPSVPPSAEASQRPSMSNSLPPPYRREFASQSSLGVVFPPTASSASGTLADMAARTDWEAREQHRLLALPHVFRRLIDRTSLERSREIVARVAVSVGGAADEEDRRVIGTDAEAVADEDDLPGLHLFFV